MKCYITGGTGFLGKNLIRSLHSHGHEIRALVRPKSKSDDLKKMGIELVYGDITETKDIEKSIRGCDWVFHTAALVKTWTRDPNEFYRINLEGMKNIIESAHQAGIKKIIYTSSFIALGPTDGKIADENYPTDRYEFHNLYEKTKYLAHRETINYARSGIPLIILYPGIIYGPGEITQGNIIVKIMQDFIKGKFPGILGNGNQIWNYVYVEDVVRGHLLAAEKGEIGQSYILGGENISLNDFVKIMAEITGKPFPKRQIPFPIAKFGGLLEEWGAYLFNRIPQNTRGTIGIFKHDWALNSTKAENQLGYTHLSLKEGLQKTFDWLIKESI